MKGIVITSLLLFIASFLTASNKNEDTILLKQKIDADIIQFANIQFVEDGGLVNYEKITLDQDKNYILTVPETSYYNVAVSKKNPDRLSSRFLDNYCYLKKGEKLVVNIAKGEFIISCSNPKINNYMKQWCLAHSAIDNETRKFHTSLASRANKLKAYSNESIKLLDELTGVNTEFLELQKQLINYDISIFASRIIRAPRMVEAQNEKTPEGLLAFTITDQINSNTLLKLPVGGMYLSMLGSHLAATSKNKSSDGIIDFQLQHINIDEVKAVFLLKGILSSKRFDVATQYKKEKLLPLLKENRHKVKLNNYMRRYAKLVKGKAAFGFKFPNIKDEIVSLADFKGKVVLIDCWASWCGPCIAEMPALHKLEKEYADKNIEFVKISFDKKKQVWLDYMAKKKMGGICLFAEKGFKSSIANSYKISGIPRFILIDQKGNLVDAYAPRPSDPKLKAMIDKLL